jgi:hypothetical protein
MRRYWKLYVNLDYLSYGYKKKSIILDKRIKNILGFNFI